MLDDESKRKNISAGFPSHPLKQEINTFINLIRMGRKNFTDFGVLETKSLL